MKKIITIALICASFGSLAQSTQVVSKVLGDNIWISKGSFEVTPIIISPKGDTARSLNYSLVINRDTSSTGAYQLLMSLFDKNGSIVGSDIIYLIPSQYPKWAVLINAFDNYIQNKRPRIVKH